MENKTENKTITLNIEVPVGKDFFYNPETRTIVFVDKKSNRSRSWNEFCENHPNTRGEYLIDSDSNIIENLVNRNRVVGNENLLATKEDAEGVLALIQLKRLHKEWIGGWEPSERDYYGICYDIDKKGFLIKILIRDTRVLMFPNREMGTEFLNCFRGLIEKAKNFI